MHTAITLLSSLLAAGPAAEFDFDDSTVIATTGGIAAPPAVSFT